jgi:arylsulfatase A-like enzyme
MTSPNDRVELYNVAQDVSEKHNLAQQNPEKATELTKKLQSWIKTIPMPKKSTSRPSS